MKKLITLLALSIISTQVFASQIPASSLPAYKQALGLAAQKENFDCGSDSIYLPSFFAESAIAGEINDEGNQPLITFSFANTNGGKSIVTVVTSKDYTAIQSVTFETFSLLDVNMGDLKNPNIVKQLVQTQKQVCTQR